MAFEFHQDSYGTVIAFLLRDHQLNELGPGKPNQEILPNLKQMEMRTMFQNAVIVDPDMAKACMAGLWLYHNFLIESHKISQDLDTKEGSYWHAIMHRREPDYSNAKYWFNRVGRHPIYTTLQQEASEIVQEAGNSKLHDLQQGLWNSDKFVDLCERYYQKNNEEEMICRRIQMREWELLFDYCYQKAIGE